MFFGNHSLTDSFYKCYQNFNLVEINSFATYFNNRMEKQRQNLYSWLILVSLMLVWGSSFILIKKALLYFDAVEVGILRVTITFIVLSPFAFRMLPKISRKMMGYIIISGIIGSFFPAILFAVAQTEIDSSLAGTLNALTPLFTLILGIGFFGQKTRWYNIIGVFIGLIGATGLIYASSGLDFVFNLKYASLIIMATICYAFNVNWIKVYLHSIDSLTITVLTFFYIGIPLLIYVLFFSAIPGKLTTDPQTLKGLGYLSLLAVFGTGLALIAFNKLIKVTTPIFASSVTYMIPVVAIIWGIIDGEVFKPTYLIWFVLIIMGILLVNTSPRKMFNVGTRLIRGRKG